MKTNDEITVSEMVKRKEARLELAAEPQPSQAVLCTSIYMCVNTCFSKGSHASVFVQVLLLLQKEKEESAPEAQVKEENRENLKHCGHGQVLNGSNYTDPPTAHYLFPATPPHLLTPFTSFPAVTCTSPLEFSLSLSLDPSEWQERCSHSDSTDFQFLYRWKINKPASPREGEGLEKNV